MARLEKAIRQSISLPPHIAKRVHSIARARKTSANRVVVDLIEAGIQAKEAEKQRFFSLANQLTESDDPEQRQRIKEELARMTFGE
jgi:metal-responsive CopG/Arc/MetJ family transcriptional regulator